VTVTETPLGRRTPGLIVLGVLVVAAAVASAAPSRHGPRGRPASLSASDLVGTEWLLEDLGGRGVVDDAQSTIAFQAGGKVTGNGGCNRYFGPARISGGRIDIEHLGSTRMACPPAIMDQEHRFLDALQKATRIERRGAFLLIHSAGIDKPLRFTQMGKQGAAPAERRHASLGGVVTYHQRVALPPDAEAQVQLIDASLADAPADVLAEQKIAPVGQVPIAFRLDYDPTRVDARRRYQLQARIEAGGKLLFINTKAHPVRLDGAPAETEIVVEPVQ